MKHLLITLFFLAAPSSVSAQFIVNLDPVTARFTYFAPPEGPGIPGGVPNPFELHFGMQGAFTIDELANNQGDITQATFTLVGNEELLQSDPERWRGLEEYARFLLLDSVFSVEHGPPLDRTVFRAQFDDFFGDDLELEFFRGTLVRMGGGPDYRPSDGHAAHYVEGGQRVVHFGGHVRTTAVVASRSIQGTRRYFFDESLAAWSCLARCAR